MDIFVPIRKLITEFVGATFNFPRPPSTNIIDGSEGFFRGLVYREGSGEILNIHGSLPFRGWSSGVLRPHEPRTFEAAERSHRGLHGAATVAAPPVNGCLRDLTGFLAGVPRVERAADQVQPGRRMERAHEQVHRDHSAQRDP